MKIHVLMEDTAVCPTFTAEHGLSLFVETPRHNLLFDTGQTGAFADNAQRLGIDLREVDLAVLSHGHYDHGGGLRRFLELNDHAPVYASRYAFMPHFHGAEKYIGLDQTLSASDRLILTDGEERIDGELSLHSGGHGGLVMPVESFGLNMLVRGTLLPDDFRHEQYLLVRDGKRKILFSGCSHRGILNIVNWFRPDVLVGGFHLIALDPAVPADRARLERAARALLRYSTRYYTGHCTGSRQYQFLKQMMGDRLESFSAGDSIVL